MKTNETQTIDADALRARLAETPADLRGRIEAALRARDPDARVIVSGIPGDDVAVALGESVVTARVGSARALAPTGTEAAALAALAVAVGLNADGSDPRAEVERLRALLAVTQSSLEAASSGRRVTACDDIERLQRERDAAECERDALYDTAREWARAEDALTAAIVAADGPDTDGAYAAAVTRRNAAHAALRDALAALVGGAP